MPWAVNTPKGQVRLMDLPFSVLSQVEKETGTPWKLFIQHPTYGAAGVNALYRVACESVGAEPRDLTPRDLLALDSDDDNDMLFVEVDDDLPTTYADGLPKAEGEGQTDSSSGEPSDSGGPPT